MLKRCFPVNAILLFSIASFLAGASHAQPTCSTAVASSTPGLRTEGQAELVGDIVLTCAGGTPAGSGSAVPQYNIVVETSAPVASRSYASGWSEALLMIDEPGSGLPGAPATQRVCDSSIGACNVFGTGSGLDVYSGVPGRPNIFQGRITGTNQITFSSVPVDSPAGGGQRTLRITNIRVSNPSPTGSVAAVQAFVSAAGLITSANLPVTVGYGQSALNFSLRTPDNVGASSGWSVNQCLAVPQRVGVLRFSERFATAFRPRSSAPFVNADTSPAPSASNQPGTTPAGETGFYAPGLTAPNADFSTVGLADSGTRIRAVIRDIPASSFVYVSVVGVTFSGTGVPSPVTSGGTVARLIQSDTGPFAPVASTIIIDGIPAAPIVALNGTASALWEVLAAAPSVENFDFVIWVRPGGSSPTATTAEGAFAPLGTTASTAIPRFINTASSANLFSTTACTVQFTSSATLPNGEVNKPYHFDLGATGGTPSYTFNFTAGTLPTGIGLTSAGLLSGTPTSSGIFAFNIAVADQTGGQDIRRFMLAIFPQGTGGGGGLTDETFVRSMYSDLLGRQPDAGGLAYWINQLTTGQVTRSRLAYAFFTSPEFKDTGLFVISAYRAVLGRDPDFGGWLYYMAGLRAGFSQQGLIDEFIRSPEFQSSYGSLDNAGFVTRVYLNALGRAPDAGGFAYYTGLLDSGALTRAQLMLEFAVSAEFQARIHNRALTTLLYMGLLRRSPEKAGADYWAAALDAGAQPADVLNSFITSAEYLARW